MRDEDVWLVDEAGELAGSAPRRQVRAQNLHHAATAVLVRNSAGLIYLHQRAADKDWAPSHFDVAAGGILRYGEDPAESAAREVAEELGFTPARLASLGKSVYADEQTRVVEFVYETIWDGPITFADREVVWGDWITLADLAQRLRDPSWPFVPDTRALLSSLGYLG
ncbi:MAG: NUDIX domain-containing protein [Nocardioidaceae bacterium]|nr:MAG: NUDIX domain-containing protein [Nocardioidaceae bacterium]